MFWPGYLHEEVLIEYHTQLVETLSIVIGDNELILNKVNWKCLFNI
jgi:hypothetical protein